MTRYRLLALAALAFIPSARAQTPPAVKVPGKVAPPTPAQVQAVPADLVESLRQHFDPNTAPTPTPDAAKPAANPLVGTTWVRECNGQRLVGTFAADHLELACESVKPAPRLRADCAYGRNGLVYGVVTAVDFEPQDAGFAAKLLAAAGSPFCFRVRLDGDTITVSDLRCEALGKEFVKETPEAAHCVLGTYKKCSPPGPGNSGSLPSPVYPHYRPQGVAPNAPAPVTLHPSSLVPLTVGEAVQLRNQPRPAKSRFPYPKMPDRSPVPVLSPQASKQRSSLDTVLEMVRAFAAENPAVVRALATEAGRGFGRWLGRQLDEPRVGEVVGVMVGSALADKLIGGGKAKPRTPPVTHPTGVPDGSISWVGRGPGQ